MLGDKSPVLLLFFNRDDTVFKVLNRIRFYKPEQLFLGCDGPRKHKEGEIEVVEKLRKRVLSAIDWPCTVKTHFNETNKGCGVAVSESITWFFENVDSGIILEDDCLPLDGFFEFCEEMLRYFKDDNEVFQIAGTNLQGGIKRGLYSYYFSKFTECWGWATWARAWHKYSYEMAGLKEFKREKKIKDSFTTKDQQTYWIKTFERTVELDTWDYQWLYTMLVNQGVCIVPNKNLIQNIGFSGSGTHTLNAPFWYQKLSSGDITIFPIKHPDTITIDHEADNFRYYKTFHISFFKKVVRYVKGKFIK